MTVSALHDSREILDLRRGRKADEAERAKAAGCPFHRLLGKTSTRELPTREAPSADRATTELSHLPEPPRPSMSRLRQTVRFAKDPFGLLRDARTECGDLFVIDIYGMGPVLYLCTAELLHQVYRLDEDTIVAGEIRRRLLGKVISPRSTVAIDGEEYRRRRRITTPYFTGRRVDRWAPVLRRLAEKEIAGWTVGQETELQQSFDRIARRAVCHVLFGSVDRQTLDELEELSRRYLEAFQWSLVQMPPLQRSFGRWSPWARFQKRLTTYRRAIEKVVRAAYEDLTHGRADDDPRDLLGALVQGYREELTLGDEALREETLAMIIDELIAFVVGGAETTAKATSWAMLGLLAHREVLERTRDELDQVVGDAPIRAEQIHKQLPYLDAVVQEGLRHQSLAPFAGPRLAKRSFELAGHRVDAGTVIAQCLSEVGQSDLFPHRDRFEPENFYRRNIRPNDWVPFGGGKRICAGMGMAQMEMAMIVGTFAQCAELELLGDTDDRRPAKAGIAYQPKDSLRVRFNGRRAATPATSSPDRSTSRPRPTRKPEAAPLFA
ncbi:MAG: cytochrome P450 [Acidobacteriota bacterium]